MTVVTVTIASLYNYLLQGAGQDSNKQMLSAKPILALSLSLSVEEMLPPSFLVLGPIGFFLFRLFKPMFQTLFPTWVCIDKKEEQEVKEGPAC